MKNFLLAAMLAASPAAAQTAARAPASAPSAIPGLGAFFDAARLGAAAPPALALPTCALVPALAPSLVRPSPAAAFLAAAAKPVEGSPFDAGSASLEDLANGTVEFYSRLTLGRIRETSRGGIEMTATRPVSGRLLFIRWHGGAGFDFIRSDGFYYFPSRNHLLGVRLSLLRTMRENGAASLLQRRLLEKLDAALASR